MSQNNDPDPIDVSGSIDDHGYAILKDTVDGERVSRVIRYLSTLRDDPAEGHPPLVAPTNDYLPPDFDAGRIYDLAQQYRCFGQLVRNERILDVVREYLGLGFTLYKNAVWYKPDEIDPDNINRSENFLLVWIILTERQGLVSPLSVSPSGGSLRELRVSSGDVVVLAPTTTHLFHPNNGDGETVYTYRITFKQLTAGPSIAGREGPIAVRSVPPWEDVPPAVQRDHGRSAWQRVREAVRDLL